MSTASQVLFHPYINASLKGTHAITVELSDTVQSHPPRSAVTRRASLRPVACLAQARSYRTVQYFSRFLAFYTYRKGYTKDTIARFSNLKSALGSARKRVSWRISETS